MDLFRAQKPTIDVENIKLRLWQGQFLETIKDNPMNDRKMIWIIGLEGNEGKSWFQSYIQSLYRSHGVARFSRGKSTVQAQLSTPIRACFT